MTALLGKAGRKLFERHLEQYAPTDPLYELYTNEHGQKKRRKRELPPGLSDRDKAILKAIKKRAHYLDKGFCICGMRFGWTFFIGLIPVVGDLTDVLLNYCLVVRKARKADIPPWLLQRMLLNNAISAGVGFVPLVGDLVLAMFKANSRNAALLEEFLRIRGEEFLKMGGVVEDPHSKKGTFIKSKKAKQAPVNTADAEQVKPGAGMTPGEVKKVAEAPVAENTNGGRSRSVANPVTPRSKKSKSGSGSSVLGLFSSRSKKASPTQAPAVGGKGRFVENVGMNAAS